MEKADINAVDAVDTLVIGLIALDSISALSSKPVLGDSNPGRLRSSVGGVGYNVSLAHLYGLQNQGRSESCRLVSIVGDDMAGKSILKSLEDRKIDTSGIKVVNGVETAQYSAILDPQGDLVVACADMAIIESGPFSKHLVKEIIRAQPKIIIVDCNLLSGALDRVLQGVGELKTRPHVIIEPTSQPKLARISGVNSKRLAVYPHNAIDMITPTVAELEQIYTSFAAREFFDDYDHWFPMLDSLGVNSEFRDKMDAVARKYSVMLELLKNGTLQQAFQLLPYIPNILVKLGAEGCLFLKLSGNVNDYRSIPTASKFSPDFTLISSGREYEPGKRLGIVVEYFAIPEENQDLSIVDVTGAGDSLLGYLSSTLHQENWLLDEVESVEQEWWRWEAVHRSQLASGKSLQSAEAISPEICQMRTI